MQFDPTIHVAGKFGCTQLYLIRITSQNCRLFSCVFRGVVWASFMIPLFNWTYWSSSNLLPFFLLFDLSLCYVIFIYFFISDFIIDCVSAVLDGLPAIWFNNAFVSFIEFSNTLGVISLGIGIPKPPLRNGRDCSLSSSSEHTSNCNRCYEFWMYYIINRLKIFVHLFDCIDFFAKIVDD